MAAIKKMFVEVIVLAVLGLALGFGFNGLRAKGSIKPSKDYFELGRPSESTHLTESQRAEAPQHDAGSLRAPESAIPGNSAGTPAPAAPSEVESKPAVPEGIAVHTSKEMAKKGSTGEPKAGHPKHDYQAITLEEVVQVFENPLTAKGLNLFVDARNDEHFEEGHIPGAVQLNPYEADQYLESVVPKANEAEKVIVYCNGGDCEDSVYACRELLLAKIPYESIYLFEGGWKEWSAADKPVAKGRD